MTARCGEMRFGHDRQRTHLLTSGRALRRMGPTRGRTHPATTSGSAGAREPAEDDGSLGTAPTARSPWEEPGRRAGPRVLPTGRSIRQGLQNPTVPSNTLELGLPSASRLTSWSRPASSTSGRRMALLSGAQTRWLSAYWSKYGRNSFTNRLAGRTTRSDLTAPSATSTKIRCSSGPRVGAGVAAVSAEDVPVAWGDRAAAVTIVPSATGEPPPSWRRRGAIVRPVGDHNK